jgi:MFS family permease
MSDASRRRDRLSVASPPRRGRVVAAAIAGTTIGWYDFFLFLGVVPLVLFPRPTPADGLPTLVLLGAGFLGRLAGGALFGHVGDRLGRRATLVATLLTLGLPTAAIGLLPVRAPLGTATLALLTLLRLVQGAGLGGEWAGAVLIAMEWEPNRGRRGFIASLPQVGVPLGLLLAMAALAAARLLPPAAFLTWGWRLPFLLGLVLVGVCWLLRRDLPETPEFRRWRDRAGPATWPVLEVVRHQWRQVAGAARARLSADLLFYGCVTTGVSIGLGGGRSSDPRLALVAAVLACAAAAAVIPLAGRLSDRYGRGPVYGLGIAALALVATPLFTMLGSGARALVVVAMVAAAVVHAVQYGPQAALIAEGFTPRLRYAGSALSYQLGSIPAGILVPVISVLVPGRALYWIALGVVACCLVSASALLPPRRFLVTVASLSAVGAAWLVVAALPGPSGLAAALTQTVDGHSMLWTWVNNLGNVIALVTVAVWLIGWLGGRAARRCRDRTTL